MGWQITAYIGAGLLALAAYLAQREHRWLRAAQITQGEVIQMIAVRGSKGGTSYKPRVAFSDLSGAKHEFVRSYSSSPPTFRVGDKVTVAYDAASYQGRILTFGQRFGFATFLAVFGLALLGLTAAFQIGPRFVPEIYLFQGDDRR